jgi:hypothetical protein
MNNQTIFGPDVKHPALVTAIKPSDDGINPVDIATYERKKSQPNHLIKRPESAQNVRNI